MTSTSIAAIETGEITVQIDDRLRIRSAIGMRAESRFLIVRVMTSDGVPGYGEVSATPVWSGEDAETAAHHIRDVLAPVLVGAPLIPVARLSALMDRVLAGNPFTKAAVSTAALDALGRTVGLPVAALLGGPLRSEVPVKLSLSGDGNALERSIERARELGFEAFKVKVGLGVDSDVARVRLARRILGDSTFIGIDANARWSRLDAHAVLRGVADLDLAFVEQPLHARDLAGTKELKTYGIPLLVDESVYSTADLVDVIERDAASAVAVYVGKAGGLERAAQQMQVACAFGLGTLVGSNGEMGVGAAAQVHLACACDRLGPFPSDITAHLFYEEDILREPVRIDGRFAYLPEGPGLGVDPDDSILRRFS
jgi:L-alanine-DL-glutamate epimerase-like enolase superfamily enzyme